MNWQLSILAAAAALGLQACDVNVRDTSTETTSASQPAPAIAQSQGPSASGSIASSPTTVGTTEAAPSGPVADSSALPASPPLGSPTPPLAFPNTGAMGAGPASSPASVGTSPAPAAADGVAAPTELGQFFEAHPVKPRSTEAAAGKTEEGKSSAAKADTKGDPAKGSKS